MKKSLLREILKQVEETKKQESAAEVKPVTKKKGKK